MEQKGKYQICKRCIMDTSDPEIEFDENGICNHCKDYDRIVKERVLEGKKAKEKLKRLIEKIKEDGKGKQYDCILGVSGGVDSTYTAYLAKKSGLRPLAVHMDNGWNTKTATKNINKIVKKLGIDLYTYVIDWEEFKDLQLAYLKASVVDTEALTDHAIKAVLFKTASKHNVKYIISGVNILTEGVMPRAWVHNKNDYINIKAIHKFFGHVPLKTFPFLTLKDRFYYQLVKKINYIELLNYVPYNREKVKSLLSEKLGWEPYEIKHGESLFTYFFQNYILPTKFKIDKRKVHFSALIRAKQMSREIALKKINEPLYEAEKLAIDKGYVLNKFGLTEKEFENIMSLAPKNHSDYKSQDKLLRNLRKVYLNLFNK